MTANILEPAVKSEIQELRKRSPPIKPEPSESRPRTPPVRESTESAVPSPKSSVEIYLEKLSLDIAHAANTGNFEITSYPWTHCSPNFIFEGDILPAHDRGYDLTNLANCLEWHKQMHAEKAAWVLECGELNAHADENAGRAFVFAKLHMSGIGSVKVEHTNVMEFARYGTKENGVWKLLAMSSLRGMSLNDGS
ncbi:hypothetical protein CKM354_000644100 [Cercospora kikuchii]|uniref:Uncharacterized protein n=1 Tax=Cercospora kikuchii TaxID=84275 RepID=A0A9P3CJD7_9PEZI|nr:uncharacterized protein CKM354_000644100 [Cercospora kikuchii]GIZ43206.1 hypothetical protein CKM354_000644100 [Cercospora kikuchii]